MKKKLLICGATGFIGRNIAEHFSGTGDFDIYGTCLSRPPYGNDRIKVVRADLTDKRDVERVIKGMDIIVQAAATTSGAKEIISKPYYHVTDNAVMNSLIFRAAYEHKVSHVVFFSCILMYQSSPEPVKESDFDANREIHPKYFGAGWTKAYIEKMCEFYSRIGDTKYTVVRHSNVYGPHDKFDLERSHVFGATVTKVVKAENGGSITMWGDGREKRDLMHVSDLVGFVKCAIDRQKSGFEVFNAGGGNCVSVKELAEKIIRHSGKDISIKHDLKGPSIKTSIRLDNGKAGDLLGWQPGVGLDDGIKKTLEWHEKNIINGQHGAGRHQHLKADAR